ncbi:DNA primase [Halalkalibacter sp. APA_J-10(15)]|uniref:DNA primase n=1 Tax=unclassified Halalkalibacter TaxID=2893063 RepID=UPI001FF5B998|nr:DNA primase [Halalkalibacter sp. APA_J-10(15)]MCK0471484.1 DNA primase [Halalkalibacter sp. APA_J-10(15)]
MSKKFLYTLLAGALSVSVLAACGDEPAPEDVDGGDPVGDEEPIEDPVGEDPIGDEPLDDEPELDEEPIGDEDLELE